MSAASIMRRLRTENAELRGQNLALMEQVQTLQTRLRDALILLTKNQISIDGPP
jgi:hypothetical protein